MNIGVKSVGYLGKHHHSARIFGNLSLSEYPPLNGESPECGGASTASCANASHLCDPDLRFNTNPTHIGQELTEPRPGAGLTDVTWYPASLRPVRVQPVSPVSASQPGISRGSHTPPPCVVELDPVRVLRARWRQGESASPADVKVQLALLCVCTGIMYVCTCTLV